MSSTLDQLPVYVRAVLEALNFRHPRGDLLASLDEREWRKLLEFCDRCGLTLALGLRCREHLPDWVRQRIDQNLANNAERWRRLQATYRRLAGAFAEAGLEFVVLKGFAHCPDFAEHPSFRPQGDLDLLFAEDQVLRARDVALRLGFHPLAGFERHPIDHLPAMVQKTGWKWRGDFFDPDMPVSIELHFRLWDAQTEGFRVHGWEEFWARRERRSIDGLEFTGLSAPDALVYAALHALRHLLRGDLRPLHIYEIGWFLEYHMAPALSPRYEAICFALAECWFGSPHVHELPDAVQRWLDTYAYSPIAARFRPNKDELWLHLALLDPDASRLGLLRRRLLPMQIPGPINVRFMARRISYHTRALLSLPLGRLGLTREFWRFFAVACCWDFGLFIYFLLFNLYLLQLGFREGFLGLLSSAMLTGTIAASLPAGIAIDRFGIRRTLLFCVITAPLLDMLRAAVTGRPAMLILAFLAGAASSVWAVLYSPIVAALTTEQTRPAGFSIVCSTGIAIGIVGGLVGGRLPGLLARVQPAASRAVHFREALWIGAAVALLSFWPAWRLKLGAGGGARSRILRPSPVVVRFLAAAVVWNLGTGLFNPFFTVFFARLNMPVETIGAVVSLSQIAQAAAIIAAPLVFKATGLVRGISRMQVATGVALLCVAGSVGPVSASLAYSAYMVAQYMSEPGLFSYLMDSVPASQHGGASALNFLVSASAQAAAAALAGVAINRYGYPPMLVAAALLCIVAAVLFRLLLDDRARLPTSVPADACDTP